ncbi:MAG: zinc-ribbon and DUF3426 domain-containing protein, partial [Endozoicomonas sp.]
YHTQADGVLNEQSEQREQDMTTPRVTSCPKCNTSFHVTQIQLRAAIGSVRCGSCLHVFDALSHMEEVEETPDALDASSSTGKQTEEEIGTPEPSQPADKPSEPSTADIKPLEPGSESLNSLLDTLDKEQIEVGESRAQNWSRRAGWALLTASMVVTLGLQYAWFNKDTLAMHPSLRGFYQQLCERVDCQLPVQVDTNLIRSQQLLVRSHPEINGVLIVDAVIINNAQAPQPWPLLALSFTDLHNQPVASRHFQAREFLGGELAGSREIPSGQPIRLSLEIIDPGQDAVNYSLRFFPDKSLY